MLDAPLIARTGLGTLAGGAPHSVCQTASLQIVEEPGLNLATVRLSNKQPDHSLVAAYLASLKLTQPTQRNGLSGDAQLGCAWIEPRAWFLASVNPLKLDAAPQGLLVTEVYARQVSFRIRGKQAREVIASGCDASILGPGRCARTRYSNFTVLLQQWAEDDYRMLADVSMGPALADWLRDAASALN